jgi:drug/metabolite transporter (DMT)-like permease
MNVVLQSPLGNVLLFSIFWALEIFVTKLAFLAGAQVLPFTIQSSLLTLLILSCYVLPTKLKELKKMPLSTFLWIFTANAIHMGGGTFLSNAGIQLTSAINAGFLMQFTTVSIIIFAWLLLKEKITVSKVLSIILIIIGSFLLITKGHFIVPHIGDILLILACLVWGLGGVLTRKVLKHTTVSADLVAVLKPIAGIPTLLLFVLFAPLYPTPIHNLFLTNLFDFHQFAYVIANAVIVTFVWIFFNRTLKISSASYGVILSSITPILVALLAMVFLNEQLNGIQTLGILLILASSFVAEYLNFDKH